MEAVSSWESLLIGILVILVILWLRPGLKASLECSKNAESDWLGVLLPLGLVVMFVVFLVAMV